MLMNAYNGGRVIFFVSCKEQPPQILVKEMASKEFVPVQFVLFTNDIDFEASGSAIDLLKPYAPSVEDKDAVLSLGCVPSDDCIRLNTHFIDTLKAQLANVPFENMRKWQFEAVIPGMGLFEDKFVIHFDGTKFVEATTLRPIIPDVTKNSLETMLYTDDTDKNSGRQMKRSEALRRARLNK